MNTTLGTGYVSYDNYKEFGRMVGAFDEMMEAVRPTLYRSFSSDELCYLADMRDWLFQVHFHHDGSPLSAPVLNAGDISDTTRRGSTTAQSCATTLKLIDRTLLAYAESTGYPDSYSELSDFCRWQWLHQDDTPAPDPAE